MFSLIITIISIALVAALALATLYYGGNAFNKGSAEATASKIINEGQQINGAVQLARADVANGTLATPVTDLKGLVDGQYLQQLPATFSGSGTVTLASGKVTAVVASDEICNYINAKAGFTAANTTDTGDTDKAMVVTDGEITGKKVFGCVSSTKTVQYAF